MTLAIDTTKRAKGVKRLGAVMATVALAAAFTAFTATPASAAGACSSVTTSGGGNSASYIVATCSGTVQFRWRCSSDLLFRWNYRTLSFGSTFNTKYFVGCNQGYAVYVSAQGV